jgi:hypothetical protein
MMMPVLSSITTFETHASLDRRIDVVEQSIPVRMLAAFPDLAVGLATVIQFAQQIGNDALADASHLDCRTASSGTPASLPSRLRRISPPITA